MTPITGLVTVTAAEIKARNAMVKTCLFPINRRMTIATRRIAKRRAVWIVGTVTVNAASIDGLVQPIRVALCAVRFLMATLQRKAAHGVMIEIQVASGPPGLSVTLGARYSPKLAFVRILVACTTFGPFRLPFLP